MPEATVTRLIDADVETVWNQIKDVALVENWHPAVKYTDLLSDKPTGLGATRRCNFYDGTDVVEEIIALDEESHSLTIEIREFNAPISKFLSHWQVSSTPSGATQITMTNEYEMKFSILGTALNVLVLKGKMPKLMSKVLSGLDAHIVTGEKIGKDFKVAV